MLQFSDIEKKAADLGIDAIGTVPAVSVDPAHRAAFLQYLALGCQGEMSYLERNPEKRFDPQQLYKGTQSIIVVLYSYAPNPDWPYNPLISVYAQGADYHRVVKDKLHELSTATLPPGTYRCFCDTAPLLEKYWAATAGLGSIGRNSLLLNPVLGSYTFIGIILCREPLDSYTGPVQLLDFNHPEHPCRNCRKCIEVCPGKALNPDGAPLLNARNCYSYLTIEAKDGKDGQECPHAQYGCDICQKTCPVNNPIPSTSHPEFKAYDEILHLTPEDIPAFKHLRRGKKELPFAGKKVIFAPLF